jgi:antitoxin component YwqK of YwqJK toxin-antitoxin module
METRIFKNYLLLIAEKLNISFMKEKNGKLKSSVILKFLYKNSIIKKVYYANGMLSARHTAPSKYSSVGYYKNGSFMYEEYETSRNNSLLRSFYEGKYLFDKSSFYYISSYKKGKNTGKTFCFHINGSLSSDFLSKNGNKEGLATVYSGDGLPKYFEMYGKDRLLSSWEIRWKEDTGFCGCYRQKVMSERRRKILKKVNEIMDLIKKYFFEYARLLRR